MRGSLKRRKRRAREKQLAVVSGVGCFGVLVLFCPFLLSFEDRRLWSKAKETYLKEEERGERG